MRTDHIERLSSACESLAKLAEIVLAEHERQKAAIETMMKAVEAVAAKASGPRGGTGAGPEAGAA